MSAAFPLQAVDARVGKHVFEHAVKCYAAQGGAVLMAMNQLYLLPQCDYVVQVGGGKVLAQGAYAALRTKLNFVASFGALLADGPAASVD